MSKLPIVMGPNISHITHVQKDPVSVSNGILDYVIAATVALCGLFCSGDRVRKFLPAPFGFIWKN